ncbi:MAG TPA: DUF134 domain-containing protein [Candidatus Hydrogenedentes bacterium]|nr:DUF134 domain-containing protein [Candidatus Hydrogenedentota bacterium]
MPRPCRCRTIEYTVSWKRFEPVGTDSPPGNELVLGHDELEAIRLADMEGLYQDEAASRMNISRQTFARVVAMARHKVARALVEGKPLRVEGGVVEVQTMRKFQCAQCNHAWEIPHGSGRPTACPACGSGAFHRHPGDRGPAGTQGPCRHGRRRCGGGACHGRPDRDGA